MGQQTAAETAPLRSRLRSVNIGSLHYGPGDDMPSDDTITFTLSTAQSEVPSAEVTVPRELGSVRLVRELGRGGMGVVFLGRHELLGRDVAVKFLFGATGATDDPGFTRFLEGARAAAAVRHSSLTAIHHADLIDHIPYLVMEYIEGPTLGDLLSRIGSLGVAVSVAVLDEIASAVTALHTEGIVHRDIKPSNVLLSEEGRVAVTDFGLACIRPAGEHGAFQAALAGTPAYMAPEMFEGQVSLRTDVYALGIMAFELLTGQRPFTGSIQEVRDQHANRPLPIESLEQLQLDPVFIEVLERAAHKNAMFRYKTAAHFQQAVQASIASDELLHEGMDELKKLVAAPYDEEPTEDATPSTIDTPSSSYFELLSGLAAKKRGSSPRVETTNDNSTIEEKNDGVGIGDEGDRQPTDVASRRLQPARSSARTQVRGSPETATDNTLLTDLPCGQCEYNLRGLSAAGKCPECGTDISSSLQPERLIFCDPKWLSRILLGQKFIRVSEYLPLVLLPILLLMPLGSLSAASFFLFLFPGILFTGVAPGAVGLFLWTSPEPSAPTTLQVPRGVEPMVSARRVARVFIVVATAILLGLCAVFMRDIFTSGSGSLFTSHGPLGILSFSCLAGFIVSGTAMMLYSAGLVDRIPHAKLAKRSRAAAVVLGSTTTIFFLLLGISTLLTGQTRAWRISEVTVGLISLASVEWTFFLMGAYRKAIKRVIAHSVSYDTLFEERASLAGERAAGSSPRRASYQRSLGEPPLQGLGTPIPPECESPTTEAMGHPATANALADPQKKDDFASSNLIDVTWNGASFVGDLGRLIAVAILVMVGLTVLIGVSSWGAQAGLSGYWVLVFWLGVVVLAVGAFFGLKAKTRRRVRNMALRTSEKGTAGVVGEVFRRVVRRRDTTAPQTLVRTLVLQGRVGETIRAGPARSATPVIPITVPFEPVLLDESEAAFLGLHAATEDPGSPSAGDDAKGGSGSSEGDSQAIRRVKRNIGMKGGWISGWLNIGMVGVFIVLFSIQSIRAHELNMQVIFWGLALLGILFAPVDWWSAMGKQWFVVPSGLVLRRAGWWRRSWQLHLFERRKSVLCVYRQDRHKWWLTVADADFCEKTIATKNEIDVLLSAWLSPLAAPLSDLLTDLA